MADDKDLRSRIGRKLLRKDKGTNSMSASTSSLALPERFRDYDNDAQEDTAVVGKNMNQSIFQMITTAGAKVDFKSRFGEEDSSSDEDGGSNASSRTPSRVSSRRGKAEDNQKRDQSPKDRRMFKSMMSLRPPGKNDESASLSRKSMEAQRTDTSESQDVLAVPQSQAEAALQAPAKAFGNAMAEEEAKVAQKSRKPEDVQELAKRIQDVFQLPTEEDVVSEYPCWLLKSVLLQGYMYITSGHICFYSYLPKKSNTVLKSGYLAKKNRSSPRHHRYWFVLKGDVLSYFTDPSNLYFPNGNIDLRFGVHASLDDPEGEEDPVTFSITTSERTYKFKADSSMSAREWVKVLQRVIFRSHNDGDSVKIVMPIDNIIEVDDSPVLDFADTFKIKVLASDDSFAIDEYYFSFFSFGEEALGTLKQIADAAPVVKSEASRESSPDRVPVVKTTLNIPEEVDDTASELEKKATAASASSSRQSGLSNRSGLSGISRRSGASSATIVGPAGLRRGSNLSHSSTIDSVSKFDASTSTDFSDAAVVSDDDRESTSGSKILGNDDAFPSSVPVEGRKHLGPRSFTEQRVVLPNTSPLAPGTPNSGAPRSPSSELPSDARAQGASLLASSVTLNDGSSQQDEGSEDVSKHRIHDVVKLPLRGAAGIAGWVKNRSKKAGQVLTGGGMGYLEKVTDMWSGGRHHYNEPMGMMPEEVVDDAEDGEGDAQEHGNRFRQRFALPASERLISVYFGYLHRVIPLYGKIYLGNQHICFRSILPGTKTRMILPLKDIENVHGEEGFRFGYYGLVLVIRGHEEVFFEFGQSETRNDCSALLLRELDNLNHMKDSGILSQEERYEAEIAKQEHTMLEEARKEGHASHDHDLPKTATAANELIEAPPIVFDDPNTSFIEFKPPQSLRITCLTIGSRGDVQPYIALCKGLKAEGHRPKIATHREFQEWIEKHGIEFAPVEGDPAELMRICVENGMFTYSFLKEASSKFRGWIDELLASAWTACQNSDILIESPSAMAGIHIAEALQIPYFRAFTMPWTRTRAYPHAFAVPDRKKGGAYNYFTYVMFDNVFWKATAGQVNRWRKKSLNLPPTSLDKLQPHKVPFLYNFSPHVVGPPLDFSDWIRITGYWFLDEQTGWEPPQELLDFIKKARDDGKKLVYVGFGSIVVSDPKAVTKTVVESVMKADVRCILSKGWSDRLDKKDANVPEVPLPEEIHQIASAPHDWLFQQIDAAVHHGGAGTTGASLRWGLPTVIKPFFGDQFFFGARLEDLGVGKCIKKLNVSGFSRALWEVTHDERMIAKAKVLGENIRKEDGVGVAIQAIYRDLEYARSLIKTRGTEQDGEPEEWTIISDGEEYYQKLTESQSSASMEPAETASSVTS